MAVGSASVISELEGTLLKDKDTFPYFMLVAFEASGLIRFTLLLLLWPIIRVLELVGKEEIGLRLTVFVAVAGVKESEIETVGRAVLPKFYMEDVDMEAWRVFASGSYERRVVVTRCPRLMVDRFLKEHLRADDVVGCELDVNRFGYATGFLRRGGSSSSVMDGVRELFGDGEAPEMGMGREEISRPSFLVLCKEKMHPPFPSDPSHDYHHLVRPVPVIFHDGRLVLRPTPLTALMVILWIPLGIIVATIRITAGLIFPMSIISYLIRAFGGDIIIKGNPPPSPDSGKSGVLFVCTHRTLMDPVVLSMALSRQIPAVTYSLSRLSEVLSPIPTFRLSRDRDVDAVRIKTELSKGDLAICPEGTTCREPFLLRFSSLFAELTHRIVPVAMNYRVGFFHPTTARGWKAMDPIFFFMNPRPVYEITFLDQLPVEATCLGGRKAHDVANYVQRILAATLGFECTNITRKDKYKVLAGNDGTVPVAKSASVKEFVRTLFLGGKN